MPNFPPLPPEVKHIAHFLKVADEHDERNIVVSYWSRMYACQVAMKSIVGKKPPEVTALLIAIMDWMEQTKKANSESDGILNETAAQALIEEYAIQLFQYADAQDQAENFGKNVVKAFYTAGILMDVLQQFGTLSEDIFSKRKYAKWKAAYIHNCLKNGEKPFPGPPTERNLLKYSDDEDEGDEETAEPANPSPTNKQISPDEPYNPTTSSTSSPVGDNLPDPPQTPFVSPQPPFVPPQLPFVPPPMSPFQSQPVPQPVPAPRISPASSVPSGAGNIGPEQIEKAQKYCKWAGSALTYDDVSTAVDNLEKALHLLKYGVEK